MSSPRRAKSSSAVAVVAGAVSRPMEHVRSRTGSPGHRNGSPGHRNVEISTSSVDSAAKVTAVAARKHGAAVQIALQRQMKAFEDRIGTELGSLGASWASTAAGLSSSTGSQASANAQAALAAALESCVERVAASEAWVASVDMDVRQLRVESERSARILDGFAARLESRWPASPEKDHGTGSSLSHRVERLEGELRHLVFKCDTGDEELEQLKAAREEFVGRRELGEATQTLRSGIEVLQKDLDGLHVRLGDTSKRNLGLWMEAPGTYLEGRELHTELSATMRQQLMQVVEPLMSRLEQLSESAAPERKAADARKDVQRSQGDLRMLRAGDEIKTDHEAERLFYDLKSEFTGSLGELRDATQLLKMEMQCLSDKVALGGSTVLEDGLQAMARLVREEVKNFSHGTATRNDLQEATKLLLEVKDAGKLLKEEIKSAEAPTDTVVTHREFSNAMAQWRRELGNMTTQLSEQIAMATPHQLIAAASEGKGIVTRKELTDMVEVLRQEVEMLSKRSERAVQAVPRSEFTETIRLLKQEVVVVANKAAHSDLASRRQELIDAADLMKREVRGFTERDVVTRQDFNSALGALKQELSLRSQLPGLRSSQEAAWFEMEPLVLRLVESTLAKREGEMSIRQSSQDSPLAKSLGLPEMQGDMAQLLTQIKREHQQGQTTVEALHALYREMNDRLLSTESSQRGGTATLQVLEDRVLTIESSQHGGAATLQVPMLPINQMGTLSSASSPQKSPREHSGGDHSGDDAQHLEKIVQPLRKRLDELSDAIGKSSSVTPRTTSKDSGVGSEGVAQLMKLVKRDQDQERVVVEALLARISSLCDRIGSVESKIAACAEFSEASAQQLAAVAGSAPSLEAKDQTATTDVQERVEILQNEALELKRRVDSLEGSHRDWPDHSATKEQVRLLDEKTANLGERVNALEGVVVRPSMRQRRSVQDFLGADFTATQGASGVDGSTPVE